MDIVLLIVPEWNLRQLYHELLFSKNIEVVPIDNISDAILMLTLQQFNAIVIYSDESQYKEVTAFLSLRTKKPEWHNTKVVLISPEYSFYNNNLLATDIVINPDLLTPIEISTKIKSILDLN